MVQIHAFEVAVAEKFGQTEAVLIYGLQVWIRYAATNGKNRHEGRTWVYNSARAWAAQYPYVTQPTIRRALIGLKEQSVILIRNDLNRMKWDRTKWYAFRDEQIWVPDVAQRYARTEEAALDETLGHLFDYRRGTTVPRGTTTIRNPPGDEHDRT